MNINIWLTNTCNLDCSYCYEENKNSISMNSNVAESIICFINKLNKIEKINFHGGEPLLNFKIIKQIVDALQEKQIKYSITTNGTLLSEKIAIYFKENKFNISISIDGNEYSHNLNRYYKDTSGSYSDSINGLLILKKYFENVRIRMTVCQNTVSLLYENILSIYMLGFYNVVPVLNFLENWDENNINDYVNSMEKVLKYNLTNNINNNDIFTYFDSKPINSNCDGLIDSIHINAEGNIYPCSYTVDNEKYLSGNVFTDINYNVRDKIIILAQHENSDCIGCNRYNYCAGTRCKLVNEVVNGDSDTPCQFFCTSENVGFRLNNIYKELILIANKGE
jgi:radical SAM additional 4Fe4S-binding domain